MTRPLASTKVEATGRSYSDHEALEVDLELSISDDKKCNAAIESKERTHERSLNSSEKRALKSEFGNALEEVNKAFWWGNFHLCGLFLALAIPSLRIFIVGFAFFFCAFQLGKLYIYVETERHSSLKAILQDLNMKIEEALF